MSPLKKTALIAIPLLAVTVVVAWVATRPDMNGVEISPSKTRVYFRTVKDLNRPPRVDFSLFGMQVTYPMAMPKVDLTEVPPEIAGVILINHPRIDGEVDWTFNGDYIDVGVDRQYKVMPGPAWSMVFVPYAPSPDNRVAMLEVDGEKIEVKLPYRADKAPKPLPTQIVKAGPFTIEVKPKHRHFRAADLNYSLTVSGPKADVIAIGEIPAGTPGYDPAGTPWQTRFRSEDFGLAAGRQRSASLKATLYVVRKVPFTFSVHGAKPGEILMRFGDKLLIDETGFHLDRAGFIAVEHKDNLIFDKTDYVHLEAPYEAVGYRALASYPFEITVRNDQL